MEAVEVCDRNNGKSKMLHADHIRRREGRGDLTLRSLR